MKLLVIVAALLVFSKRKVDAAPTSCKLTNDTATENCTASQVVCGCGGNTSTTTINTPTGCWVTHHIRNCSTTDCNTEEFCNIPDTCLKGSDGTTKETCTAGTHVGCECSNEEPNGCTLSPLLAGECNTTDCNTKAFCGSAPKTCIKTNDTATKDTCDNSAQQFVCGCGDTSIAITTPTGCFATNSIRNCSTTDCNTEAFCSVPDTCLKGSDGKTKETCTAGTHVGCECSMGEPNGCTLSPLLVGECNTTDCNTKAFCGSAPKTCIKTNDTTKETCDNAAEQFICGCGDTTVANEGKPTGCWHLNSGRNCSTSDCNTEAFCSAPMTCLSGADGTTETCTTGWDVACECTLGVPTGCTSILDSDDCNTTDCNTKAFCATGPATCYTGVEDKTVACSAGLDEGCECFLGEPFGCTIAATEGGCTTANCNTKAFCAGSSSLQPSVLIAIASIVVFSLWK